MYYGTSTTSLTIASSGTLTVDTQTGLAWKNGDLLMIWSGGSPTNWMRATVLNYSGTTLQFTVSASGGSGTFTDWKFNLSSGTLQHRHGLASEWSSVNPVLLKAEIGVAKDDLGDNSIRFKIGDGVSAWNALPYQGTAGAGVHCGYATMVSGSVVVPVTWVTAATIIVATPQAAPATSGKQVYVDPADIVIGTSFTIKSDDASDSRNVFWMAAEPTDNPAMALRVVVPSGFNTYPEVNWCGIRKNFSEVNDAWLSFDMAFDAAALTEFLISVGGPYEAAFGDAPNPFYSGFFLEQNGSNIWYVNSGTAVEGTSPTPTADTWIHMEFHVDVTDGIVELYTDGTLRVTATEGSGAPQSDILLGNFQNSATGSDTTIYFKDVKIGTTRGGSDIFADNFSIGDLSNWDATMAGPGTIDVIPIPF